MAYYVTVDIGGTAIKHGLADETGTFKTQGSRPTLAREDGAAGIVHKVVEIVGDYQKQAAEDGLTVKGVAISTAGIVEPGPDGRIRYAGEHFPGYSGVCLGSLVREACHLPCHVENDTNAAALGEFWLGAAKGARSAFMVTVGTGIGGAFLQDGKIWHGAGSSAGELGFLRLHGSLKLLEEAASARMMVEEAAISHNVSPAELKGETVFAWASKGDADAVNAIEHLVDTLSEGLAAVCCLLNPELIVLGGGIMAQSEYLRPRFTQRLEELVVPAMRDCTRLAFAELGNNAGMLGALYALLHEEK